MSENSFPNLGNITNFRFNNVIILINIWIIKKTYKKVSWKQ